MAKLKMRTKPNTLKRFIKHPIHGYLIALALIAYYLLELK